MSEGEGVDKLFFELASDSRLAIMEELQAGSLKMQELARKLDLTSTEAFRQLNRLSEAQLVARRADGAYAVTQYGRLVLFLIPSLRFAHHHREYFLAHDVWRLPPQFLSRMGEAMKAELSMSAMVNINRAQRVFMEAEQFSWGMAEGEIPELMAPIMDERLRHGVRMRYIVPERMLPPRDEVAGLEGRLEVRGVPEIPAIIGVSEKAAAVCFRFTDGRMDYAGFFGRDPEFIGWAVDLFEHYWGMARQP